MPFWVLILVLVSPTGNTGLTSQQIDGYTTENACMIAAESSKKRRSVRDAFCVGKDRR